MPSNNKRLNTQHTHYSYSRESKSFPVQVVAQGVSSPANIGSLCRTMDAFGLRKLTLCDTHVDLNSSRFKRTARSTQEHIQIVQNQDLKTVLNTLAAQNVHVVALELSANSKPLSALEFPKNKNIALLIGGEKHGLSQEALNSVQATYFIPMYGNNSSMNVIQAAGIALYSCIQKLL